MNRGRAMSKASLISLCAALLAGCAATPVPRALSPALVPEKFDSALVDAEPIWPRAQWWQSFGDPVLSALIVEAQTGNRDIAVAAARVLQAEARARIMNANMLPQLSGSASNTGCSAGDSCRNFDLSLGASYEADFWGLARANLRGAQEQLKSARFARQTVALTVTANVTTRYFELLAVRRRIAIAHENIAAINTILEVVQLRVRAGAASRLDLARELAQVEAVQGSLPGLLTQEKQALYALSVLLGRPPENLAVDAVTIESITAPKVGPGLPSELLLRRPDVAAAEADLAAAHASVDAARAAFFPAISLSGKGGFASTAIGTLLKGSAFGASYGVSLLQSIFDGGRLAGQSALAKATEQEYLARYQQAALNAYADVENALTQFANTAESETHLRRLIEAAREAFQISELQYRQGAADLLTVLQAQQTLFSAEDLLVQVMLVNRQAAVRLFVALGGGWQEAPEERTQPAN
jgi:NodT family efflux transporter outer membrane factor (OMF) lipoprotein